MMAQLRWWLSLLALSSLPSPSSALIPGLYCGVENCYDVLGVTRDTAKSELGKIYRRLARDHHPDRVQGAEKKKAAEERFRIIATAYETLKDPEARKDYDYFLDNPDQYYYHYYRYYRRTVAPKVDVRIVIVATILLISVIQYVSAYHKFNEAIKYAIRQPKYRNSALEVAQQEGLIQLDDKGKVKKKRKGEGEDPETIVRRILEEKMDVRGGYRRPNVFHTLFFQIIFLPVIVYKSCVSHLKWFWKYTVKRLEYDDEAKMDIIRRRLKMSPDQWASLKSEEHEEFLARRLWIESDFHVWKAEREELEKEKLANSGRYKQYRRYMKNKGPGQITFLDD